MSDKRNFTNLPTNHMEVEGELCKLFYQRFGQEALPTISAVFHEWGLVLGERMRAKIPQANPKSTMEVYLKPVMEREPRPEIKLSEKRIEMKVFTCPYRLKGAGRELCEAMTSMDRAMVEALLPEDMKERIRVELLETVAAGDECCHAIITLEDE
jgi:hypothetical protein